MGFKMEYTTFRNFRSVEKTDNVKTKFTYDRLGAITACCKVSPDTRSMSVGFSFLNPTDNQWLIRGKGLAKQKLLKNPICMNIENTKEGTPDVTSTLLGYLKAQVTKDAKTMATALGIRPYNGIPEKCELSKWLPVLIKSL